jgi:hypothetical protein
MKYRLMNFLCALILGSFTVAGLPSISHAQTATQPTRHAGNGASHGVFRVDLVTPLDSRKLKLGDPVEAKLAGGITLPSGTQVPGGTKVIGHITQVSSRSKSDPVSKLGIAFDKIVLAGDEDVPIKGELQAVAPNPNEALGTGGYIDYGPSLRMLTQSQPPDMQRTTPTLYDDSSGVKGFKNISMGPNGVLTSTNKEIKLDAGTLMLLNVTIQ